MGGGSKGSTSKPIKTEKQINKFNAGVTAIGDATLDSPTYQAPGFVGADLTLSPGAVLAPAPEDAQTMMANANLLDPFQQNFREATAGTAGAGSASAKLLSAGDYEKLQNALYDKRALGLDRDLEEALKYNNEMLNNRGIWSSGIAQESDNNLNLDFGIERDRALADAIAQRYAFEQADNSMANQIAMANAANATQAGIANAGYQTQAGLANANNWNQLGTQLLGKQADIGMYNAGQFNDASMFNSGQQNAANMFNTGQTNNMNQFNAGQSNAFNLANTGMQNEFNLGNAANTYKSEWAPLDYLANLWGGAGGQITTGGSSGGGLDVGGILGGAGNLGLGAAAMAPFLGFSDRRLKKDITRLFEDARGFAWYSFKYVWDSVTEHVGVMADEVEKVIPRAVMTHPSGFKMVDYSQVV
jgi:hypothetical protein